MSEKPDIPLIKRQIEAQVDDYARAIADYAAFMEAWRARQPQPDQVAAE